jgi:hypothetical protein
MRAIVDKLVTVVGIPATALAADNTPAAVDVRGFDAATIAFDVGVGGITFSATHKVEFKVTHSDDDSTYTAVVLADVDLTNSNIAAVGTGGIVYSLIAAHAAGTVVNVGYTGGKRYLKILADFSGTHGTATPMGVVVIKGLPHDAPTA